jgi:hypothetical protein
VTFESLIFLLSEVDIKQELELMTLTFEGESVKYRVS